MSVAHQLNFCLGKKIESDVEPKTKIGHFRVAPTICFKARLIANTIYMQMTLIYSHENLSHFHKSLCPWPCFENKGF